MIYYTVHALFKYRITSFYLTHVIVLLSYWQVLKIRTQINYHKFIQNCLIKKTFQNILFTKNIFKYYLPVTQRNKYDYQNLYSI